jgi:hypothetical protein
MKKLLQKLQVRQAVLAVVTLTVIVSALLVGYGVFPAYKVWRSLSARTVMLALEHDKLNANLAAREYVDEQFKRLGADAGQQESDQITLS